MSKIDKRYIDALGSFTEALEEIVETLRSQQKNNKADVVNEFLSAPMDNLVEIVKDLKTITQEGFKDLKTDNKEILAKIESIKQQKESGSFDKIEDPKNKNKIVDGIKVVILIAAGVLALGMAFKIIGKVDFLSVIALSTGMLVMAVAFGKMSKIEGLTYAKIAIISAILPIMSLGLLLSGLILKNFPSITFGQGMSLIVVGSTIGIASWFLLQSLEKVNIKRDWATILALPLMLPLISTGLLLSGFILKFFPTFTFGQGISLIMVGATIGVASWFLLKSLKDVNIKRDWLTILALPLILPLISIGLLLSGAFLQFFPTISLQQGISMILVAATVGVASWLLLKSIGKVDIKKNWATILALPLILPLISLSLVLSSYVLQGFKPLKNPFDLLVASLVVGLSVLFFVPSIILLSKLNNKQLITGIAGIIATAGAILVTSYIFSLLPDKMKYPPFMWSIGAGFSIGVFGLVAFGLGYVSKKEQFWEGLLGIPFVAAVILAVDYIIGKGKYSVYPKLIWSLGVGLAVGVFGLLSLGVGYMVEMPQFWVGLAGVLVLSGLIIAIDYILNKGQYSKFPAINWTKGVGMAMLVFGVASLALGALMIGTVGLAAGAMAAGIAAILIMAGAMLAVDIIFKKGTFTKYPSKEWASGVSKSMTLFSGLDNPKSGIIGALSGVISGILKGVGGAVISTTMIAMATAMLAVDEILSLGNFTNYPSENWARGVSKSMTLFVGAQEKNSILGAAKAGAVGFIKGISGAAISATMIPIATAMVEVDKILSRGNFKSYPSEDWIDGICYLMANISDLINNQDLKLKNAKEFLTYTSVISPAVKQWTEAVSSINFKTPSKSYSDDFAYFLITVSGTVNDLKLKKLTATDFNNFKELMNIIVSLQNLATLKPLANDTIKSYIDSLNQFKNIPEIKALDSKAASIINLSNSFMILSNSLGAVNSSLSGFITLFDKLDTTKFKDVLKPIEKYNAKLEIVNKVPGNQINLLTVGSVDTTSVQKMESGKEEDKLKSMNRERQVELDKQAQFYKDVSEIKSILTQFKDYADKPSQAGSFYK